MKYMRPSSFTPTMAPSWTMTSSGFNCVCSTTPHCGHNGATDSANPRRVAHQFRLQCAGNLEMVAGFEGLEHHLPSQPSQDSGDIDPAQAKAPPCCQTLPTPLPQLQPNSLLVHDLTTTSMISYQLYHMLVLQGTARMNVSQRVPVWSLAVVADVSFV